MLRDIDELNEEEINYLHGKCDAWAINNFKTGDEIIAIVEYDYDIESDALMHACLYRNGFYVDVRGETTNFDDILDDFDYGDYDVLSFNTINEFKKFLQSLEQAVN